MFLEVRIFIKTSLLLICYVFCILSFSVDSSLFFIYKEIPQHLQLYKRLGVTSKPSILFFASNESFLCLSSLLTFWKAYFVIPMHLEISVPHFLLFVTK